MFFLPENLLLFCFRNQHAVNLMMMMVVMEVIMIVILARRKKLIGVVQLMKTWMIKVEMNLIIQIMTMVIKIKRLQKKITKTFCVCWFDSHASEISFSS